MCKINLLKSFNVPMARFYEDPPNSNLNTNSNSNLNTNSNSNSNLNTNLNTNSNSNSTRMFTQDEVNRILSEEKRKYNATNEELVNQLETLRETVKMTDEQKEELNRRIEELKKTYQTSEVKLKDDLQKLKDQYTKETKRLSEERDAWRQRYEQKIKTVEVYSAAVKYEAYDPEQINAILERSLKVIESKDAESGQPTGNFEVRVDFLGEREGRPVKLDLTVDEAVKMMRETPKKYGNLFKNSANSGLGLDNENGDTSIGDLDSMTPEQYAKARDKVHAAAT